MKSQGNGSLSSVVYTVKAFFLKLYPTRKRVNSYWAACCDSIVLITQEAEAGGPQVQGQSGQLSEVQTK